MITISARQILSIPIDAIWNIEKGLYDVILDDESVVRVTHVHLIISRYCWEMFVPYPESPILIQHLFVGKYFSPTTHLDILANILFDTFDIYRDNPNFDVMDMTLVTYQLTNRIYNDFTYRLEAYVASNDILDYIEIYNDPRVASHIQAIKATAASGLPVTSTMIEEVTNKVGAAIKDPAFLLNNPIVRAVKSNNTKIDSLLQSIAMRGTPTDVDSRLFRKSIIDGYLYGLKELVDQMMDSRTSSKSQAYSRKPMQDSEYLNRKLQLVAASLHKLYKFDCGSKDTMDVTIRSGKYLRDYSGKFYLDPDTGAEMSIRPYDKHLIGRTLKVRTVFNCKVSDRYGLCVKCMGELGYNMPEGTNIGHQCSINLQSPVGQLLLSAKHYTSNGVADEFVLSEFDQRFIVTSSHISSIDIAPRLAGKKFLISVFEKEATAINDLPFVKNVKDLSPMRVSEMTSMLFTVYGDDGTVNEVHELFLSTQSTSRKSSFSVEALGYIKEHGWTVTENGLYQIDMSAWDASLPFLVMPLKQFSTPDFMNSIERFVRGESTRESKSIVDFETTAAALAAFHDLVSERLSVNISNLEVIMLSCMVEDIKGLDYRLPLDKSKGQLAKYKDIILMRSIIANMAYQGQADTIFKQEVSYTQTARPPHTLDKLVIH